jgi:putative inorganic carbon (HCO3(-)) transporter
VPPAARAARLPGPMADVAVLSPAGVRRLRVLASIAPVLAAPIAALAVYSPVGALAVTAGVIFLAVAVVDLAAGLSGFVVLTFFALLPGVGSSFVSVVKLAGAALLLSLVRGKTRRSLLRERPLVAYLTFLLLAWTFASSLWAQDDGRVHTQFFTLLLSVILVFVVYGSITEPQHARWLVRAYVTGAALSAVAGVVVPAPANGAAGRLSGGVGDPNELALLLVPGLALAFFSLPSARGHLERSFLLVAAAAIAFGIFESGSRGGLVALLVALAAGLVVGGRLRWHVVASACALGAIAVSYFVVAASPQVKERVLHFTSGGGTGRTDIWAVAESVARDHPLLGIGAGNFPVVEPSYAARTQNVPAVTLVVDRPHVVHNSYLELLAELGIPGLLCFLGLVATSVTLGWRAVRRFAAAGEDELELLARGVLVALCGILVAAIFLSAEYEKQLWLLLGFTVPLARIAQERVAAVSRHG